MGFTGNTFDMTRLINQTLTAHISRMEAANSIGNSYEWNAFKKEIEDLQAKLEQNNKEKAALRNTIKIRTETIRQLKYKLRFK